MSGPVRAVNGGLATVHTMDSYRLTTFRYNAGDRNSVGGYAAIAAGCSPVQTICSRPGPTPTSTTGTPM